MAEQERASGGGEAHHRGTRLALYTRRIYTFENEFQFNNYLKVDCSIGTLREFAARVWCAEQVGRPMPQIVAGRGTPFGKHGLLSYYDGEQIVLSRGQRNRGVLLHEQAHAIQGDRGYVHGPAFTRLCLYLYTEYGRVPPARLINAAQEAKIL